jgi:hypothetical protein
VQFGVVFDLQITILLPTDVTTLAGLTVSQVDLNIVELFRNQVSPMYPSSILGAETMLGPASPEKRFLHQSR